MKTKILCFTALMCATLAGHVWSATPLVTFRAELDRAVLPANQPLTTVVKISLDSAKPPSTAERPPVNLCIVLDRSGSMSGTPIQYAREAAIEAVNRLGPNDIFSLVTYDSVVETLIPAAPLRDKEEARQIIRNITPRGMTALFGGVSQGAAELRRHLEDTPREYVHRMILLSDGLANVGPSSPNDLARLGVSLAKEGISISTVGLGPSYNEELMTRLARSSDGNTYYVQHSRDLPEVFSEELGDVLNVTARGVFVRVECPPNVRPVRTLGREATIRGQTVELRLNQLYGGQERFLLLEIEIPAGRPNQEMPLLKAIVNYENMLSQQPETASTTLAARFSASEEEVRQNINPQVFNQVMLNRAAEARIQAVELMEAGRRDEALGVMNANVNDLRQWGELLDLDDLTTESQRLEEQEAGLRSRGLTPESRKQIYTEAEQEKMQQRYRNR